MISEPFSEFYSVFLSFGYFSATIGYTVAAFGFIAVVIVEFWSSSLLLVIFLD